MTGDAEALEFSDDTFDAIWCSGVLHHLDVQRAFGEMTRVLKPGGSVFSIEALGHNPLFNQYRRRTPYLRSDDEHPLRRNEVDEAYRFLGKVGRRFFHLATLAPVPFRRLPGWGALLAASEKVDSLLLGLPGLRWQAWQVATILSDPLKR